MLLSLNKIMVFNPKHAVKRVISLGRWMRICLFVIVLAAATTTRTSAIPLEFTVDDLGGGMFHYSLTLNNQFGESLSGLNIFHGFSVFGLDHTSVIGFPSGWDFFAPLPPLVDELNWFSLSPATDVPIGGSLSGFTFQSTTDPATLTSGNFGFDVISGQTGRQLTVPEQTNTGWLLISSIACLLSFKWRCQRRA